MDKIQETREHLIKKYGQPQDTIIDGKKYRYINIELNNFNDLINSFFAMCDKFEIEIKEDYINLLCEFAMNEVQPNVENVAKKFNQISKRTKNISAVKRTLGDLLQELEEFYYAGNYNPMLIMSVFVNHLKCQDVKYQSKKFTVLM